MWAVSLRDDELQLQDTFEYVFSFCSVMISQ